MVVYSSSLLCIQEQLAVRMRGHATVGRFCWQQIRLASGPLGLRCISCCRRRSGFEVTELHCEHLGEAGLFPETGNRRYVKVRAGCNQDGVAWGQLAIAGGVHLRQRSVDRDYLKVYIDFYSVVYPH